MASPQEGTEAWRAARTPLPVSSPTLPLCALFVSLANSFSLPLSTGRNAAATQRVRSSPLPRMTSGFQ